MPAGKMVELNLNPDERTLKQFGLIALFAFSGLSLCAYREVFLFSAGLGESRMTVVTVLAVAAVLSGMLSVAYPKANRLLFVATSVAAYPIGFVMSYVVLGVLFFVIFAPIGAFLRWTGRDPMERAFDQNKSSYWIDISRPRSRSSYFRQF